MVQWRRNHDEQLVVCCNEAVAVDSGEMENSFLLMAVMVQVGLTLLAWRIGAGRGRGAAGFLCGFLLGPLGVVAALFLPAVAATPERKPGGPVVRQRSLPRRGDPLEEFEARERWRQEQRGGDGE